MSKKTLIAVPCMDMIHTGFVRSIIEMEKRGDVAIVFVQNTLIYIARNTIANKAIENGFDRVMWIDSDMILPPDALTKLSERMDSGIDFVSALYFRRRPPIRPVIYEDIAWNVTREGDVEVRAIPYEEYPKNTVFLIDGAGFGCCMTSVNLLKEMVKKYGSPFTPLMGMGEDLAFCWRATQSGFDLFCDSGIKCGHIGQYTFTAEDVVVGNV